MTSTKYYFSPIRVDELACTRREFKDSCRSMPMTRAREVILYTQPDCHLCDLAAQMLEQCAVNWYPVDIESEAELMQKYGSHIPVLYRPDVDPPPYLALRGGSGAAALPKKKQN